MSATEREPFSGVMAGMTCMLRQTAAGCSAVWICYHSHTDDSLAKTGGSFLSGPLRCIAPPYYRQTYKGVQVQPETPLKGGPKASRLPRINSVELDQRCTQSR